VKDLTVVAIPVYFGSMGAEYLWLRNRQEELEGSPGVYERKDTIASLTMGVGSLLGPLVMPKLLKNIVPGKGKYARPLLGTAVAAAAATTVADAILRANARRGQDGKGHDRLGGTSPETSGASEETPDLLARAARLARPVASAGGVVAIVAGGTALTTSWQVLTSTRHFRRLRLIRRLGNRRLAAAAAIFGWDFVYYWNHRAMHESRFMWAIHVVHHSSERYNLSTALRQPVADAFGTFLPYGAMTVLGIEPELIEMARGVNLVYQFWIHTETVNKIGPLESVLNTPSHHRVHHGSNGRYLDRNHGSILIIWDKLFGTFEPEGERVVYGLTKNINTFNPLRIATHEYGEIFRDVARSTNWRDRLSFVLRGPGWAGRRRAEMLAAAAVEQEAAGPETAPAGESVQAVAAT
jgi:sterol desaturase/sphingolipid hydroxylase (fatty acid hydroxylase superfamily)